MYNNYFYVRFAARLERSSFSEKTATGKCGCFFRKKREWKTDKAAIIIQIKLMKKIPHDSYVQTKIINRVIWCCKWLVLHKGLVDMLAFQIEKHSFDFHIEIDICNWPTTNGIRVGSWQNVFIQQRRIVSGCKFCEIINFDSCLDSGCFFEGRSLIKNVNSSHKLRNRQQILIA